MQPYLIGALLGTISSGSFIAISLFFPEVNFEGFVPGITFGAVFALYTLFTNKTTLFKALLFVIASTASYYVAYSAFIIAASFSQYTAWTYPPPDPNYFFYYVGGIVAGGIGGFLLSLSSHWLLIKKDSDKWIRLICLSILLALYLSGITHWIDKTDNDFDYLYLSFFFVWQVGIGSLLARYLEKK